MLKYRTVPAKKRYKLIFEFVPVDTVLHRRIRDDTDIFGQISPGIYEFE